MKKSIVSKWLATSAILSSTILSSNVFAAGTEAGTLIENTATVSFTRGTTPATKTSKIGFKVDEVINVNVTSANASNNITNGDTSVAITYTVTNIGNGPESFKLFDSFGATNELPLADSDLKIYYIDTASADGFDPNTINETLYTGSDINILSDESITVYIVTNVPNGAVLNSLTDLKLEAVSQTASATIKASESAFGTVIPNVGEGSTNAIIAANQGRDSASSELKVTTFDSSQALDVTINKLILGASALLNNTSTVTTQKIPGAMVTYFIKVTVKNDTAKGLSISDFIPANMTYVANSLRLQKAANSTINTPTYLTPALASNTSANYSNFTALTDTNTDSDGAEALLNSGNVESINVVLGDVAPGEYALLLDAIINN